MTKPSQSKLLRSFLVAQGLVMMPPSILPTGDNQTWLAFRTKMPDNPDNCLCLYDTDARADGRIMRTGENIDHPGIVTRIRSRDYDRGFDFGQQVLDLYDRVGVLLAFVTLDQVAYKIMNISRRTDLVPLGEDKSLRQIFTIDAKMTFNRT